MGLIDKYNARNMFITNYYWKLTANNVDKGNTNKIDAKIKQFLVVFFVKVINYTNV